MSATVMLIEDTASLRMLYAAVLRRAGFAVHEAATAREGLDAFSSAPTEAVLLDLMLPDRDGLDLMRDLLALEPRTGVIAITANGSILRAIEAMRAGASDFLVKPFDESRMIAATRNALAARAVQDDPAPEASPVASPEPFTRPAASPSAASTLVSGAGQPGRAAPENAALADALDGFERFVGASPAMQPVHALIRRSARSMATIFITGENGTGKEVCARAIHRLSPRAQGPFVPLDCAAVPAAALEAELFGRIDAAAEDLPGALSRAHGGTLFLDGICEMAPAVQSKLLRFCQTSAVHPAGAPLPRQVDVRIVCATTGDPAEDVRRGRFREDLYYRLHVVPIHLPPLRARGADTVEIAAQALTRFAAAEGKRFTALSEEVKALFLQLPWPGNVRQLLNVIHNAVVLHDGAQLTVDMLPREALSAPQQAPLTAGARAGGPADATGAAQDGATATALDPQAGVAALRGRSLAEIERLVIEDAVALHQGSVSRAAQALGLSASTIYRKRETWKRGEG